MGNSSSHEANGKSPGGTRRIPPQASPALRSSSQRRKKSIELNDDTVPASLAFSPMMSAGGAGQDEETGTLRGAMQGKAAHVVYGPRRPQTTSIPGTPALVSSTPGTPLAGPITSYVGVKPVSIALPQASKTTAAPLHKIGPHSVDPDDTMHPSYKASPRLTSDVLLSSDHMPVLVSPLDAPDQSPFFPPLSGSSSPNASQPQSSGKPPTPTSLAEVFASLPASSLLPPTSSVHPYPPTAAPAATVLAPEVPASDLPISADSIPSGTSVVAVPSSTLISSSAASDPSTSTSPAVLLPPNLFNVPVAAIPIPLLAVPSATIAASLKAAAVDVGAGPEGIPTLIKWKDEDGQSVDKETGAIKGPKEVFVTGTFAKGWKMKIELRKNSGAGDFSALISLPPGPHRLKFIVDREWKASKHLQLATDADGNLINYLHVNATPSVSALNSPKPITSISSPWMMPTMLLDEPEPIGDEIAEDDDDEWCSDIPKELLEWDEEAEEAAAAQASYASGDDVSTPVEAPTSVPPPMLPAQLEKGPLNHAAYVTQGSGDDNSILPKPDHSVINHLAASPIKGGFLSVGVTTRYKRKFVTIVYYKALASRD